MKRSVLLILFIAVQTGILFAQHFVSQTNTGSDFPVASGEGVAAIYVDKEDDWLVHKAAALLQQDIAAVTGKKPEMVASPFSAPDVIVIGTLAGSKALQQLIAAKKISVDRIKNNWEAFKVQTISNPVKGVRNALVIAGNDKRGAAYGVFTLSRQLGVSPWYWWADVPVKKKAEVFVKKGAYTYGTPSVKYRGIFINDEAPAFSGWAKEKFGGINHRVYEHVFELLLRLKANYLWPAMWGNAFNDDDTLNAVLADKWGIVMGTSHHEPMLRAQQEWKRYGSGTWDYTKNDSVLRAFWKKGIEKMDHHESIITIGMRGDGDEPMTSGTAIDLLERIVADQRNIIEEVTRKPARETPQLWALYKEVQDYYDQGMRVPDDVTLLLCDDNWGNIRRLPKLNEKPRSGGYGIYYHFDYVGGPRNYKWINTNNIARVWEQMHLAYAYNARQIWIVNVGDLKPMEFPVSFFLDYAYNTDQWTAENLNVYYQQWAKEQFGATCAKAIAAILEKYAQYASGKKPELLNAETYSLENYNEAQRVTKDWNTLLADAGEINSRLPETYKAAYFQLVLHPVKAYSNLQHLYTAVGWNHFYYQRNDPLANRYAEEAERFYKKDSLLTIEYHQLNNGKWNHMMDQKHIGYTYWQEPPVQKMPEVKKVTGSAAQSIRTIPPSVTTAQKLIPSGTTGTVFYEKDGYVSIGASHFTIKKDTAGIYWKNIPGIGREGDGITAFPVTASIQGIHSAAPYLQYDFYTYDTGVVILNAFFSPTLNFHNDSTGLQYAVSIDNDAPQIISVNKDENQPGVWDKWAADNCIIKTTKHFINKAGKHSIKYRMISPAVVLQKIVLDLGGLKPSYLGPPETIFNNK
ncbi:glycosyhydrolase [Niabella ginsenosidivorans]|uniref:Glycosyhydrolase n=1 Tax=Niabella ginsenosidivorans TaxID=1176587 RepID=A0A1A9I2D0_9BACT|nr:glycosyl hydrolase 115 family protein [Niabella ginsenosidivorans]ANH81485.1 glycosyhydrolase [Niabella ginsenosidivorans]